ncbi:hypothetical protein [Paenibacillus sp. Y412MC10]|uniref:hypothetical protein n=1 Tax=Geobacillus sp. (strain Y412MC10) TaxID=481743 RepID=UPI0021B1E375|nr:hypothetical protein [Paenibacillus sp. Y412MC10]
MLSNVLKEADKKALPVPLLLPGGTDGRWFTKLGIGYNFTACPCISDPGRRGAIGKLGTRHL